jgi:hypothetical protein
MRVLGRLTSSSLHVRFSLGGFVPLVLVPFGALPLQAQSREIELGIENYYYRTTATALNRDNLLGLEPDVDQLRATLGWKESHGGARAVFRGYVERRFDLPGEDTRWVARQAYAQYWWGAQLGVRAGKQRIGWGSGFAWNPTNRIEPPKSALNTGIEQEGVLAARLDWVPAPWAGVVLVAARTDLTRTELPTALEDARRRAAALRARFLARDTDLALVLSGGKGQRSLVGLDLGRDLGGVSLHAEAALTRGAELPPAREDRTFLRLVAGALHSRGTTAIAIEYFFNGEGYDDDARDRYLAGLDAAYRRAIDPALAPPEREGALAAYLAAAALPYSGGLGLGRHYLHASWSRSPIRERWTAALRGVVALSDGGVALTPGVGFAPRDDLTLRLDAVLLLGPAQSEYRLAPLRGAVQFRAQVHF